MPGAPVGINLILLLKSIKTSTAFDLAVIDYNLRIRIADTISTTDVERNTTLVNLMCTCRGWYDICAPVLYRQLTLTSTNIRQFFSSYDVLIASWTGMNKWQDAVVGDFGLGWLAMYRHAVQGLQSGRKVGGVPGLSHFPVVLRSLVLWGVVETITFGDLASVVIFGFVIDGRETDQTTLDFLKDPNALPFFSLQHCLFSPWAVEIMSLADPASLRKPSSSPFAAHATKIDLGSERPDESLIKQLLFTLFFYRRLNPALPKLRTIFFLSKRTVFTTTLSQKLLDIVPSVSSLCLVSLPPSSNTCIYMDPSCPSRVLGKGAEMMYGPEYKCVNLFLMPKQLYLPEKKKTESLCQHLQDAPDGTRPYVHIHIFRHQSSPYTCETHLYTLQETMMNTAGTRTNPFGLDRKVSGQQIGAGGGR